jgi:hypothetical protein
LIWCSNGRKAGALGGRVASVGAHVVGLTKSGSGKCRLAGEALAFRCAMITVAVGTWVELGRSGGLTGGCGRTDVVGIDGEELFDSALTAVVIMVSVVQCPGGAALDW